MAKEKMENSVFSNGSSYAYFMSKQCGRCKKYVPFEEATKENPVCPIEESIAMAQFDEKHWPDEVQGYWYDLESGCKGAGWECSGFEEEENDD